jgi:hypothetical protein
VFKKKSTTKRSAKKKIILLLSIHSCFTYVSQHHQRSDVTLLHMAPCQTDMHARYFTDVARLALWNFIFQAPSPQTGLSPMPGQPPGGPPVSMDSRPKTKKKRGSSLPTLILLLKDHRSSVSHIMFHSSEPTSCHTKMTNSFKDVDHLILFWPGRADQITWPFFSGICSPCLLRDLRLPGINFDTCYN